MEPVKQIIDDLETSRCFLSNPNSLSPTICAMIDKSIFDTIQFIRETVVARELTDEEWQKWKKNQWKRDPIYILWEYDTTPMWITNPEHVHEPALLMGKCKLFNRKPTYEQCKAIKWPGELGDGVTIKNISEKDK